MEKQKRKFTLGFDRLLAILTIPIALFLIVVAYQAPRPNIPQMIGPQFVPIAILSFMILFAIIIFIDATREMKKSQPLSDAPSAQSASEGRKKNVTLFLLIGGLIIYGLILETVGFVISTTLLIIGSARLFEKGKWVRNSVVGILFSIVVYYCFVQLLEVSLPAGILPW
jgi:putative tricarboxylic transport membrane protein